MGYRRKRQCLPLVWSSLQHSWPHARGRNIPADSIRSPVQLLADSASSPENASRDASPDLRRPSLWTNHVSGLWTLLPRVKAESCNVFAFAALRIPFERRWHPVKTSHLGLRLAFRIIPILVFIAIPVKARTQSAQEKRGASPVKLDGLTLQAARKIEFSTDEGTWISVDVSSDGRKVVFDL